MQIKHNKLAVQALQAGDLQTACDLFKESQNILGQAYCAFFKKDIKTAKLYLKSIKESYSSVNWLLSLISIVEDKDETAPTYFQIRNFYEQDLQMLFLYKQKEIIQKILNKNKYFEKYNKEIYKYSARVLINNEYYEIGEKLLLKSLDIFYKDPETHYLLGQIYETQNNIKKAQQEYIKANEAAGEYIPAKIKLEKLNKRIV